MDNAGKTSIITAITKKFGFEEEASQLMPTRRIARDSFKFLGLDIIQLDMGGQRQYREEYLQNPEKYLSATDLIFYVIDVQDNDRYNEALDYLDRILLFFIEEQTYPSIAVLFHKIDPDLPKSEIIKINQRILALKQTLTRYSNDFDLFF